MGLTSIITKSIKPNFALINHVLKYSNAQEISLFRSSLLPQIRNLLNSSRLIYFLSGRKYCLSIMNTGERHKIYTCHPSWSSVGVVLPGWQQEIELHRRHHLRHDTINVQRSVCVWLGYTRMWKALCSVNWAGMRVTVIGKAQRSFFRMLQMTNSDNDHLLSQKLFTAIREKGMKCALYSFRLIDYALWNKLVFGYKIIGIFKNYARLRNTTTHNTYKPCRIKYEQKGNHLSNVLVFYV